LVARGAIQGFVAVNIMGRSPLPGEASPLY
jgi:hypothetical protein